MPLDSPNPFADPAALTLADLIEAIGDHPDCSPRERRELRSALCSLAKWFGLPPSTVPANLQYIRQRLTRFHPAEAGISERRLQNVRSLVMKAFRHTGLPAAPSSYLCPLTAEWQELYDRVTNQYARWGLSRLMRYCSAQGIAPADLTDAVLDRFKSALAEESLVAHPRRDHQTACRLWNKMREEIDGWPDIDVIVPRFQETYGADLSRCHPKLAQEIGLYLERLKRADPLDAEGPSRPFRPASLRATRSNIARYLGALEQTGEDITRFRSLAEIVDFEVFKTAVRWFWARNGEKPTKALESIAWTVRCIAIKWCQVPDADAERYKASIRKLRVEQQGLSAKNDALLRRFDDPDLVARYVNLPQMLWDEAERRHNQLGAHRTALLAQTAVAVEILLLAPMRAKNLVELDLDAHLVWLQPGGEGGVQISIPADAVKNRAKLNFELPFEAVQRLKVYLERHRPILMRGENRYLFPGRHGNHKDQSCLSRQITKGIWRHAGIRITPHQFRHIAAKLLLDRCPGAYELVRKLLGHKQTSTAYEHYSGREAKAAGQLYTDIVLGLRIEGNASDKATRRPANSGMGRKRQPGHGSSRFPR